MRSMDSNTAKQMQPSNNNTLDFIDKINQVGKNESLKKPEFYMQEETKQEDKMDLTVRESNMATRIDFDAFPAIPAYEGI